ncbi:unnamed protein product [Gordionus sp. m RMFG-2023]
MHGCWQRGYCKLPRRSDWITKRSPLLVQQYLKLIRFDKPIGTWLLFWPGAWSLTLATSLEKKKLNLHTDIWPELSTNTIIDTFLLNINFPDLNIFLYFVLGSFLMRNAGCIINDIFDKDFDSHVKRTQERPLASNKLSTKQALNLLTFHLVGAFVILLQLNTYTVILGLVSMIPTVTYPLAKRYFPWPQLHLGIVFNWGALMGWSAIFGSLQPILPISILSIACICWIVLYDTVYAHQDKIYDKRLGLNSTALYFEERPKLFLYTLAALQNSALVSLGMLTDLNIYYYFAILINTLFSTRELHTVNLEDPTSCSRNFNRNKYIGWIMFLGLLLS